MKIRPGRLEEFKRQAAVIIAQAKAKDPGTLQYEWFLSSDKTECEVREARDTLFEKYAMDHFMVFYGDPSPEILQKATATAAAPEQQKSRRHREKKEYKANFKDLRN